MILGVMLDADPKEKAMLGRELKELTAHYTDEKLDVRFFGSGRELLAGISEAELLDMAVVDVTLPGGLDGARQIRKKFAGAQILVLADLSVSPMEYMQPAIQASALLLRPMMDMWKNAVRDFFCLLVERSGRGKPEDVLWAQSREGAFRIPINQIYYLEAREKKVFVRIRSEEFGIGGTLEKIAAQLPENFVRCHRSFIVNQDYISRIKLSENMLYLSDGLFVPVSRSYKEVFRRHE